MLEQTEHLETETPDSQVVEGVEVEKEADPEVEKERSKKRLSDRLREQTFHRRNAERTADALRKENEELKARAIPKQEPDPEDYADRDKYTLDRETWKAHERQKIRAEESENIRQEAKKAELQTQFEKQKEGYISGRVEAIKDDPKYAEYEKEIDKVVEAFEAPEIQDLILAASKQGPRIVKYLGTNPDELEEIASASPKERAYLMGKLVAKLEAKPVKTISTAPNPTRSEKGSAPRPNAPTGKAYDSSKETWAAFTQRQNGFR